MMRKKVNVVTIKGREYIKLTEKEWEEAWRQWNRKIVLSVIISGVLGFSISIVVIRTILLVLNVVQ